MIPNHRPASEYRVRTLDRNDLNEKGKIYIGKGGTTTVDGVAGVSDITAKNIIDAINDNSNGRDISAGSFTANSTITSGGNITATGNITSEASYIHAGSYISADDYITSKTYIHADGNITSGGNISSTTHSIMVVDASGKHLAEMDGNGHISSTNGNITAANGVMTAQSFNAKSDKRLKENIEKYSPKQSVLDLPVYSYNFIKDTNKTQHIGCLAQDLQKICPEIVHEGDDGFLSIEENKLVYLLLEEVKQLNKKVKELEAK